VKQRARQICLAGEIQELGEEEKKGTLYQKPTGSTIRVTLRKKKTEKPISLSSSAIETSYKRTLYNGIKLETIKKESVHKPPGKRPVYEEGGGGKRHVA